MRRLYLTIFVVLASAFQAYAIIDKDSSKWTITTISSDKIIDFDADSPADIQLSGTITVNSGCTLTILNNSGKTITITKTTNNVMFNVKGNLVIEGSDGNNIVLDGGANYSFSKNDYGLTAAGKITGRCITTSGHLNLKHVTIQNCNNYTADGGGIHVNTTKQTILDNCVIQKCTAWRGSAIVISANDAEPETCAVIIRNSTITQCVTGGHSRGDQNNCGGAIRTFAGVSSNLYLTNVTMSWNYSRREIEEYTSSPHELYHDGNGGALFWNGRKKENTTCYIEGCTFEYNKCDDNGGAIKAQGSIVFRNDTTIIQNNTAPLGAGIFIEGYTGNDATNIKASITYDLNEFLKIKKNTAVSYITHTNVPASGKGAGIYFDFGQNMTLKAESTITVNLNGAKINGNRSNEAGGLGGGIYYDENSKPAKKYKFNIYLNHGEVIGNSANANGGGIYVSNGNVTYNNNEGKDSLVVMNNSANNGAGIYIKDGNLKMAKGTITQNHITGSGNGGGIYIENGDFTIEAGEVSHNTLASGQGAGVYIVGSGERGNFTMNGGEIKNNTTSGNNGGGVYINGGNFILNQGKITGNNSANGGGVFLNNGDFSLVNGDISGNTASGNGGGVYLVGDNCVYKLKNGSITGNSAQNGGGVYLENGSFTLAESNQDNGSISGNSSRDTGGGVYIAGDGDFTMNGGEVKENSTTNGNGGGIYLNGGNFTMNDGKIVGNGKDASDIAVTNNGGGVYLNGGTLKVTAGTISDNASTNNGGGLYIMNGTVTMGSGTIQGNACGQYGGGVYVYNSPTNDAQKTVNFSGGTLSGNLAKYGGGVCVDGLILMSIGNVEIAENTATNGGGVCLMNKAIMEFGIGEIKNNMAEKRTSTEYDTGYEKGIDKIEGFGGGVYLDSNTELKFGKAENLGLFGNLADSGGDEIFANGKGTYVDLPDVSEMALGGYPGASNLKWIEDYPTEDPNYDMGTKLKGDAWDSDPTNLRYRETISQNATIYNLPGATSRDTRYICFALGYEIAYITITRSGLRKGESAIYHLRKNDANDFNVILTGNPDGTPVTKRVAVTAGDWTVTETSWSWAYQGDRTITRTVPDPEPVKDPITGKAEDRPFAFEGTRITTLPLNHEDIEINVMGN